MSKINCSKTNGTVFEQFGLAFIAAAGQPYFANNGYIATSDEDIQRWVDNDYLFFTRYLHENSGGFQRGWGVQGKIHIKNIRIDPDFFDMETGSIYEFKYQESSGSMIEKLYKNFLTYQAIPEPSFIVHHGAGFNDRFFNCMNDHREYLKRPDATQFITFNQFVQEKLGLSIDLTDTRISISTDKVATNAMRKKSPKLSGYMERVIFDADTNKEITRFKTLQLLEDASSDGFKSESFFKKCSFAG